MRKTQQAPAASTTSRRTTTRRIDPAAAVVEGPNMSTSGDAEENCPVIRANCIVLAPATRGRTRIVFF
ncbi:MAG: hypothetical protein C0483_05155 [Pirellula sp.]|nr:hypothetical protein [Pirellula sp.]